jgi:hypothetical protein
MNSFLHFIINNEIIRRFGTDYCVEDYERKYALAKEKNFS